MRGVRVVGHDQETRDADRYGDEADRGSVRGRAPRGHSRGYSRGHSRGYSRGHSRGYSRGHEGPEHRARGPERERETLEERRCDVERRDQPSDRDHRDELVGRDADQQRANAHKGSILAVAPRTTESQHATHARGADQGRAVTSMPQAGERTESR